MDENGSLCVELENCVQCKSGQVFVTHLAVCVSESTCARIRHDSEKVECIPFCSVAEYNIEQNGVFTCTRDARGYFAIESTGELVESCDSEY